MTDLNKASVEMYQRQGQALLPQGAAWPTHEGSVWSRLMAATGATFARVHNRALDLIEEADPRTTFEMLADWERVAGLPDPCAGELQTTEGRRKRLVATLTARGGASIPYYVKVAADYGYDITIEEFNPPRVGEARIGDPLWSADSIFVWRVNAPSASLEYARVGEASIGDPLWYWSNEPLECAIRRRAPAHTTVLFGYADPPTDYGLITEPVELIIDDGLITEPHDETRDYGEI